jgi:hypothetical protein
MGRPRNSNRIQVQVEEEVENHFEHTADTSRVEHTGFQDTLDVDMGLLDPNDLSFMDLMMLNGPQEHRNENPVNRAARPPEHFFTSFTSNPHLALDINFDAPPSTAEHSTPLFQPTLVSDIINDLNATLQQRHANPAFSASAVASPPPSCSCLLNLHQSISSLHHLPDTLPSAISTVRTACKTVHDALLCPHCSNPSLPFTTTHQTTLLLQAALLPTLSAAYIHLLGLIDASATLADSQPRKITFNLTSYGGLWGMLGANDHICGAPHGKDGLELQPAMWRLAVRALLRIDVYGVNENSADWQGVKVWSGFTQPGVMDFVKMMEEREQVRRGIWEEMRERGEADTDGEEYRLQEMTGLAIDRILHVARETLRGLEIP